MDPEIVDNPALWSAIFRTQWLGIVEAMNILLAATALVCMANGGCITEAAVDERTLCELNRTKPIEGQVKCNPDAKLGSMGTLPRWLKPGSLSIDEALKKLEGRKEEEDPDLPQSSRQD